jgi:hypothetical protein
MISLSFSSNETYEGKNYTIEYAFVLTDPDYSKIDNYVSELDRTYYCYNEEAYYQKSEYIGRSIYFNVTIKEDLFSTCNDKCSLCYKRDSNSCIICKYNYTFNEEEEKICFSKTLPQTTILLPNTTILKTTQLSTTLLFTPITTLISSPYSSFLKSSSLNSNSLSINQNDLFSTSIFSSFPKSSSKQSLIISTNPKSMSTTLKNNIPTTLNNIPTTLKNNIPTTLNNIPTTIKNIETTTKNFQTTSIVTNGNIKTS